jgi:hypothetical protein
VEGTRITPKKLSDSQVLKSSSFHLLPSSSLRFWSWYSSTHQGVCQGKGAAASDGDYDASRAVCNVLSSSCLDFASTTTPSIRGFVSTIQELRGAEHVNLVLYDTTLV